MGDTIFEIKGHLERSCCSQSSREKGCPVCGRRARRDTVEKPRDGLDAHSSIRRLYLRGLLGAGIEKTSNQG